LLHKLLHQELASNLVIFNLFLVSTADMYPHQTAIKTQLNIHAAIRLFLSHLSLKYKVQ